MWNRGDVAVSVKGIGAIFILDIDCNAEVQYVVAVYYEVWTPLYSVGGGVKVLVDARLRRLRIWEVGEVVSIQPGHQCDDPVQYISSKVSRCEYRQPAMLDANQLKSSTQGKDDVVLAMRRAGVESVQPRKPHFRKCAWLGAVIWPSQDSWLTNNFIIVLL